jgi:hypothetical protein
MYEPIKFKYLVPKAGRAPSEVLLQNYTQKTLTGKIVAWDSKLPHNYLVFASATDLYKYILALPDGDRTLNEVIFGDRRHKIHFDIDKATPEAFERIRAAIRHIWQTSKLFPPLQTRKDVRVLTFDTGGDPMDGNTVSRHVIINYYVPTYEAMKIIAGEVRQYLISQKNGDERYLDMVYGSIHNMRILFCKKIKDGALGPTKRAITRGFDFKDSLIQI